MLDVSSAERQETRLAEQPRLSIFLREMPTCLGVHARDAFAEGRPRWAPPVHRLKPATRLGRSLDLILIADSCHTNRWNCPGPLTPGSHEPMLGNDRPNIRFRLRHSVD